MNTHSGFMAIFSMKLNFKKYILIRFYLLNLANNYGGYCSYSTDCTSGNCKQNSCQGLCLFVIFNAFLK